MRTSIATVSISGPLERKLAAAAAAGFDAVEIFENDLIAAASTPEEVRARAADLGLEIALYQPFRDVEAAPPDRFAEVLRRAGHKFALMRRLGADLVLVCSTTAPWAVDDDALAAEQLHRFASAAEAHGIRVAYEALAWGRHVDDYRHAWRIVRMADHPALGTCLDSFHILSRGTDTAAVETIPGDRVFFLQLADAPLMAMDVLQWSRHYRCFPGQGELDVAGVLAAALRAGYTGPASLEVFNDVYRRTEPERGAVDAMRSLLALQEEAAARLAAGPAGPAAERARARLRAVPAAGPATGFAFTELAVSAAGGERVAAQLAALGFTRRGRHRTKPVDLWASGPARVLVTEADGGPDARVAALGLETADPAAAVARAEALLAPVLPRTTAAGDAPLDAVAAPDGTEMFFCRTGRTDAPSWTDDFAPAPEAPEGGLDGTGPGADPGSPLEAIDHVGLPQPRHHVDEAALFYRSVLALRPSPSVQVADPYGLVRSRAVGTPDGAVRLALSIEDVDPHGPAPHLGLQHVAVRTGDIRALVRRARARGAVFLGVPPNYYDDLEARYDLDPGLAADLRDLGLMYDRDADGAFLHCYLATVGRVFFEVVQRVGGYAGFGAANAPVRRAAQRALTTAS
ncbi:sugar phosphate isomerase/epimerase and 4-hydroxyphenylpyruvate domain-containing protein [Nocardiopsis trehalosi]|uniref:sugar phosphate isomerase/epimerase and 4-hydroxyphenylpyruvate domain-containing protein n=1 Tax=Nocardiopsis trehalosi TaxID=109329 RepID=UPI00082999A3|nr:sugar phosphate isomerase/epimerase and 4-hydroxyphenylpyruvate domain-containing protein [Nocardiopsis trehalosi]